MSIEKIIKTLVSINKLPTPDKNYTLIFSRKLWETKMLVRRGYSFSKEELDSAEESQTKLIGNRNGVDCYLLNLLNNT